MFSNEIQSRQVDNRIGLCLKMHRFRDMTTYWSKIAEKPNPPSFNNNNNNNTNDNIYGAVIVAESHCESSPGSCDEYGTAPSGRRPSDQAKRSGL